MYVNNKVKVKINASNFKHYVQYYSDIKCGDDISVNISELTKFSNATIILRCDKCEIIKELSNKNYRIYGYNDGEFLCRKCKLELNNIKKYGVGNVFQVEEIKDKIKRTNIEKYGKEYISQSNAIREKIKKTNIEKYGFDHHLKNNDILKKQKLTNIEKYGIDNISKVKDVKEKKIETCLLNNGVDFIFKDPEFQKKVSLNNLKKYGNEILFKSNEIKEKIKRTNIEKYGTEIVSKNNIIKEKIKTSVINSLNKKTLLQNTNILNINSSDRIFSIRCHHCDSIFDIGYFLFYKRRETNTCICTICNPIDRHQSGLEIELQKFIVSNYNSNLIFNSKIDNKEFDILLPDKKIAFEFNGLYWHSEIFKSKNFHKEKSDIALLNNIQLFHIWEDDWIYRQNIVKSMILNKIGLTKIKIMARKCDIKQVDNNTSRHFLNENHLQGYTRSSYRIGLFYDGELVSLMCFIKNKDGFELNRFCNKINTIVQGSSSKLLNFFIKNYSSNIFTFSDNSYSNGNLYEKIGFTRVYSINPDYYFVKNGIRIHKFNFRNKSTSDLYRIYDAGKIKYKYDNNKGNIN